MEISKPKSMDEMAVATTTSDFSKSDLGLMIARKRADKSEPDASYESNQQVILRPNIRYVGKDVTPEKFGEQSAAMIVLKFETFHNFVDSKLK